MGDRKKFFLFFGFFFVFLGLVVVFVGMVVAFVGLVVCRFYCRVGCLWPSVDEL